ncbi:MAG: hypothetical protein GX535_13075 [Xanthomonadaceae bacterium]|nr:hypothetical protein [Xanthomonadaceae bacterium]
MNDLIPIFAIVFAIGLPLSIPIVFLVLNYRKRRRLMELHHAERMAAIERGMDVPPLPLELIDGQSRRRRSSLLPGLVWLFVGLAVLIALGTIGEEEAVFGLIPTGVGLAYLIYYFVEGRKIELRQFDDDASKRLDV